MGPNQKHLTSPLSVKELTADCTQCPNFYEFEVVSRKEYDALIHHDPTTIYFVLEVSGRTTTYLGDLLIGDSEQTPQYTIALLADGSYGVYSVTGKQGSLSMSMLYKYTDPNDAIKELTNLKNVGNASELAHKLYITIAAYISKIHGINETILLILSQLGYRDHPSMQYLSERAISYGVKSTDRDLPALYRNDLRADSGMFRTELHMAFEENRMLIDLYADIYDVFVAFDFFKGREYQDVAEDELDLAEPVRQIMACVNKIS